MDNTIDEIVDCLSKFIDYIENFTQYSRERDNAIQRLEEAEDKGMHTILPFFT